MVKKKKKENLIIQKKKLELPPSISVSQNVVKKGTTLINISFDRSKSVYEIGVSDFVTQQTFAKSYKNRGRVVSLLRKYGIETEYTDHLINELIKG